MQEIIDKIAAQVGIEPELAHKATSMIVAFIVTQAPERYVDAVRGAVPGFDELAAAGAAHTEAAEAGAGGGGLMGALGGLMGGGGLAGALGGLMGGSQGGGMAAAMALLGHLQQDGLDFGQVKEVAGGLLEEMRAAAGEENVAKLLSGIPGAERLIG